MYTVLSAKSRIQKYTNSVTSTIFKTNPGREMY